MTKMTKVESKIHEVLCDYDKVRKAEGYAVVYRRWSFYADIATGVSGKRYGEHVETLYIHPKLTSLLVKVMPDGGVSAWEAAT